MKIVRDIAMAAGRGVRLVVVAGALAACALPALELALAAPGLTVPPFAAVAAEGRNVPARHMGLAVPHFGNLEMLVSSDRPSASAIQRARRQANLPEGARAVGYHRVERGGHVYWKIIFVVGNRQVAAEVSARQ